ncbi:tetratricopeptide repeat protein [Candidatus Poribacteria bacterium]|nr:tetratricopeptide repeat protein [Candidatus Poribacteria bacterium]
MLFWPILPDLLDNGNQMIRKKIRITKRQAITEFQRAAEIDPADPTVFNNIGAIYGELGEYNEAARYLRKALEIDPDLGPAKRQLREVEERLVRTQAGQSKPQAVQAKPFTPTIPRPTKKWWQVWK